MLYQNTYCYTPADPVGIRSYIRVRCGGIYRVRVVICTILLIFRFFYPVFDWYIEVNIMSEYSFVNTPLFLYPSIYYVEEGWAAGYSCIYNNSTVLVLVLSLRPHMIALLILYVRKYIYSYCVPFQWISWI